MGAENQEIVRRMLEAFNKDGFSADVSLAFFDADAVFEEPPEQPAPRTARGRNEVREVFNKFDQAWETHRSEIEELREVDDDRVLVLGVDHFRGRDGIEIDQPSAAIFTFRDGKVIRMQAFWNRETAVKVAGTAD